MNFIYSSSVFMWFVMKEEMTQEMIELDVYGFRVYDITGIVYHRMHYPRKITH